MQGTADQGDSDTMVVSGSLLRRTDPETSSPVTVLTSDALAKAGITNVSDAIRSISADSAGSIGSGFRSGFSAGGSAVSLRSLGVSSTLVLVDGRVSNASRGFPYNTQDLTRIGGLDDNASDSSMTVNAPTASRSS